MAADESLDPDRLFDTLVDKGILDYDPETDEVTLTENFDSTLRIYEDTYGGVADEEFHSAIAEVFELEDIDVAAQRAEEHDVTREELAAFLALQSHFDEPPRADALAVMASLVTDVGPGSPVPAGMEEVTDGSFRSFLDEHDDVILSVWRHHCDPCDALKRDLQPVMDAAPEGVRFVGVNGEDAIHIQQAFDVEAAPTVLAFRDGELADRLRGRRPVEAYVELFDSVYG